MTCLKPLQIGLTGGIGAGKSTIARLFEMMGIPIYESDSTAKRLMETNANLKERLIKRLGKSIYKSNGTLDKDLMRAKLFESAKMHAAIETCVHPVVWADYETWLKRQNTPYVIKVAALLFESGQNKAMDAMVLVCSPWHVRLKRIQKRNPSLTKSQIEAVRNAQWDEKQAKKKADYLIYNDEKNSLIAQVQALPFWEKKT